MAHRYVNRNEDIMGRLDNEVAVITGGARGMGASHARRFVAEGARVIVTDVLEDEGKQVAGDLGESGFFVRQDVCSADDWRRVVDAAEDAYGPITVLVNNAGRGLVAPLLDTSESQYRAIIDVNQVAIFLGMKFVAPSMQKANKGSIINVSSLAGLIGAANNIAYAASKFAVTGMTRVAAKELGQYNIRVNSIHPGHIATPLIADTPGADELLEQMLTATPLARAGQPEEATNLVLFLASDEASYITGSAHQVDGGILP